MLSLVASLALLIVSPLAHKRTFRPSTLITAFLLARLLCFLLCLPNLDVSLDRRDREVNAAQLISTLLLVLLELQSKRTVLLQAYSNQPPEAVTSFIGNWVFLWINPILAKGYRSILSEDATPVLDEKMLSKSLRLSMRTAWDKRGTVHEISPSVGP